MPNRITERLFRWARRYGLLLAVAALLLSVAPAQGQVEESAFTDGEELETESSFIQVAENGDLALAIELDTANIRLTDRRLGKNWYSNPIEEDTGAGQEIVNQMRAQLNITYFDEQRNEVTANSYLACVMENTYEVRKIKDGVRIIYDFSKPSMRFRIPLEIRLVNGFMEATIPFERIEEYGTSRLLSLELLPYFGAGKNSEDGYLFIPDGCGGLVSFADGYRHAAEYRKSLYGDDPSRGLLLKATQNAETIRMPVFGIRNGRSAFLSIICSGDADASIFAFNDVAKSMYAWVGSSFVYRPSDLTGIRDKEASLRVTKMLQENPLSEDPVVRYYFLSGENADYSGMARQYRTYLEETYHREPLKTATLTPLLVGFFGTAQKNASFPYLLFRKKVTATTFEKASAILENLELPDGMQPDVLLYGFEKGGYENAYVNQLTFDRRVGGLTGYQKLLESANGAAVFTVLDLLRDYDNRFSLFKSGRYVRSLNMTQVIRKEGVLSTGEWDDDAPSWKYVTLAYLCKSTDRLINSLPAKNGGIAFRHMGEEVYSDFQKASPTSRQDALDSYRALLRQASEKTAVAGEGNIYLLESAELMYDIPLDTSGHDLLSQSVPFYQMVLHGYVRLASKPVNQAADKGAFLLRALETGVEPSYWLTGEDPALLQDTALEGLYNTHYIAWEEQMKQAAGKYQSLQAGLSSVRIYSHQWEGDLSITRYENGTILVANYARDVQMFQGCEIPSLDIVRLEA